MESADEASARGAAFEQAGNADAALGAYERALALDPACRAALIALPLLQHRLGLIEPAAASYRRYLAVDPLGLGFVINLANMLMQEGDGAGAWAAMMDYLHAGGADQHAVGAAAYLAETVGGADTADVFATAIRKRWPENPIVLAACADIAGWNGDPVAAVAYAEQAGRLDPAAQFVSRRLNIPNYQ